LYRKKKKKKKKEAHTYIHIYLYSSPFYMAPELFLRIPFCGPEVDVWALGISLYELLYGDAPEGLSELGIVDDPAPVEDWLQWEYTPIAGVSAGELSGGCIKIGVVT
jgi:serine/threonine protein kinase